MRFPRVAAVLATALVLCCAAVPAAADEDGRLASWVIEPIAVDGGNAIINTRTPRLLQARVLPIRLAVPSKDYVDDAGAVLIKSGSQLVWVPAMGGLKNDKDMYCAPRQLRNSTRSIWRMDIVSNQLVCFIDSNHDGQFEGYQNCYSMYPSVLNDGKCRGTMMALSNAPYATVDRAQFRSDMRLILEFVSKFVATQCVGNEKGCTLKLAGSLSLKDKAIGSRLSWLGSDLVVKGSSPDGVDLAVEKITQPRVMVLAAPWALFKTWF